jgi:hypothetical protein
VNGADSFVAVVASTQSDNVLLECPQDSRIPIIWRRAPISVIERKILKVRRQSKWLSGPVDEYREHGVHFAAGAPFQQAIENCPIEHVISDHHFIQSQIVPFQRQGNVVDEWRRCPTSSTNQTLERIVDARRQIERTQNCRILGSKELLTNQEITRRNSPGARHVLTLHHPRRNGHESK